MSKSITLPNYKTVGDTVHTESADFICTYYAKPYRYGVQANLIIDMDFYSSWSIINTMQFVYEWEITNPCNSQYRLCKVQALDFGIINDNL